MRVQTGLVLLLCLLACGGCSKREIDRRVDRGSEVGQRDRGGYRGAHLAAGKGRRGKGRSGVDRRPSRIRATTSAAAPPSNLASFANKPRMPSPRSRRRSKHDGDARVREAAGIALSRIDPERFPPTPQAQGAQGTVGGRELLKNADSRAVGAGAASS